MSEWKRHRGSKYMPKCLEGKQYEAMRRDGTIAAFVNSWVHNGWNSDVMKYRILPSEPAAKPDKPDYSKGFPEGTTAKDIGAKVGDEFVVVCGDSRFKNGDVVKLAKDDGSDLPWFSFDGNFSELTKHCMYWHELAPIPQKTAIELQAEEVGIPEPVQHVAGEWIEWKGGDCPVPKGTLVDVRYRDGVESFGVMAGMTPWLDGDRVRGSHKTRYAADWECQDGGTAITAYRLHQPQEVDTGISHITPADVRVTVDLGIDAPKSAPEFLQSALSTLTQRGKDYDKPEGERSAAAVAVAFNAITGKQITDAEVYLVLQLVKDVRQWQCADFHADSALDCVAYAALKAEALAKGGE